MKTNKKNLIIIIFTFFIFTFHTYSFADDYNCKMTTKNNFSYNQTLKKVRRSYLAIGFQDKPYNIVHEDEKVLLLSSVTDFNDGTADIESWAINKKNLKAFSFYAGTISFEEYEPDDFFAVGQCKVQTRDETKKEELQIKKAEQESKKEEKELEKEKKEKEKKEKEYEEQYPYKVILKCGLDGKRHLGSIIICFAGGKYGADTELKIFNGEIENLYKAYNMLNNAGYETSQGFIIENLSKDFYIVAQNASENLILTMEVYKKPDDKIIYSRSEGLYGTLLFRGN